MRVEIVGKNGFVPSQVNKEFVEKKLERVQDYFQEQENLRARVVCKVYPNYHKVEITIPTKNVLLRAESKGEDIYSAVDLALDKLERQVRKFKTRVKEKDNKSGINEIFAKNMFDAENLDKEIKASKLVRNKEVELEPMTLDEAMEQLELTGHDFFIYQDKGTHKVNVIYVRDDGDYAVIETK